MFMTCVKTVQALWAAEQKFREDNEPLLHAIDTLKDAAERMGERFARVALFGEAARWGCAGMNVVEARFIEATSKVPHVVIVFSDENGASTSDLHFPLEWLDLSEEAQVEAYKAWIRETVEQVEANRRRRAQQENLRKIQELEAQIAALKATL
jgi:hypothetical protein